MLISEGEAILIAKGALSSNSVLLKTSDGHGIFDKTTGYQVNASKLIYILINMFGWVVLPSEYKVYT